MTTVIIGPTTQIGPSEVVIFNAPLLSATEARNVGSGAQVFKDKIDNILEFRSLLAGAGISLLQGLDDITITNTAPGAVREAWFPADVNQNTGDLRTRRIGSAGSHRFDFWVPNEATAVTSVDAVAINISATPGAQPIDLNTDYGAIGQLFTNHSETDAGSNFTIPAANTLFLLPLNSVTSVIAAGDFGGVFIDHMGIGGNVDYLGVRVTYTM